MLGVTTIGLSQLLEYTRQIESFVLSSETAVIAEIKDACMEPVYKKGDWVGGYLTRVGTHLLQVKFALLKKIRAPEVRMIRAADSEGRFNISYLQKNR